MSYEEVEEVRIGKFLELTIDSTDSLDERVKEMCEKLLVNTVIEDYRYEVEEVVVQ
jgi:phosphoribosylformylglycinamidine synthase